MSERISGRDEVYPEVGQLFEGDDQVPGERKRRSERQATKQSKRPRRASARRRVSGEC